jgi:hypothetical protein
LRLELWYALQARDQVMEVVRAEQACCAFLTFALREDAEAVRVTIQAPERARAAAAAIFAGFRSGLAGRGCC